VSSAAWIGGIYYFLFVSAPAVHALTPKPALDVLNRARRHFQILTWVAISLLLLTGLLKFLLTGIPSGGGYRGISVVKLFLFLAMIFHHCLQSFKYSPRITLLTAQTQPEITAWTEPLQNHWKRWFVLHKINAALGPIVLLLGLALSRS
jgi:uncharacterized membrane protein